MKNSRTLDPHHVAHSHANRRGLRRTAALLVLLAALVTCLPAVAEDAPSSQHPGVVNINKADVSQLQLLPRVGPALAERIFAYRESNGEFAATEDLILVQGIGEKTFQMLRTFVVVKGETTLARKLKTSDVPVATEGDGGDGGKGGEQPADESTDA